MWFCFDTNTYYDRSMQHNQSVIDGRRGLGLSLSMTIADSVRGLHCVIIIISLFQEDNIFGMNASLTYGPRLQR